jgi:hypothetical protein
MPRYRCFFFLLSYLPRNNSSKEKLVEDLKGIKGKHDKRQVTEYAKEICTMDIQDIYYNNNHKAIFFTKLMCFVGSVRSLKRMW